MKVSITHADCDESYVAVFANDDELSTMDDMIIEYLFTYTRVSVNSRPAELRISDDGDVTYVTCQECTGIPDDLPF